MSLKSRIRSAVTGRFVNANEATASPATTVRETYGDMNVRVELWAAAEAVVLGAGFESVDGRVEVNQADLDRLRAAVRISTGQP